MNNSDNIVQLPDPELVRSEGGEWVTRMDGRGLSKAEEQEFQTWLRRSPLHAQEFERLSKAWDDFDILDNLNYLEGPDERPIKEKRPFIRSRVFLSAIAASIAAVLVLIGVYRAELFPALQNESFQTVLGQQQTVTLADGSTLILNTNSAADVTYTKKAREVRLLRGEAHFTVAKNRWQPFLVYAGDGVVKAVGTAFAVRVRESETIEVVVSEGRIELLPRTAAGAGNPNVSPVAKPLVEMVAGESATMRETNLEHLAHLPKLELDRKLSWRRGLLAFAGEPLEQVVREVGRYTDFEIEIEDSELKTLPVGGYFKTGEVKGLLQALESTFGIGVRHLGERRVLLYKKT